MSDLTRAEALRILELESAADPVVVKQAYRRLALRLHPDAGGDPRAFHDLQRAYERLVGAPSPTRPPSRSSRPKGVAWAEAPTRQYSDESVDTTTVDWDREVPETGTVRADRETVAVLLAGPHADGPIHPLMARSRGPRSPLNRFIRFLDPDLTATWTVDTSRERGLRDHDVEIQLVAWSRAARRRIDGSRLPAGWTAERGSSSVRVTRALHPSPNRRATALRVARSLETALRAIDWPLQTWVIDLNR
ncbi:MAG: J domain-containing protein [Nitriliruptorales bacterium]|nr:J domain-containing protein [Nitriliruptorales bacterium]